jgi:hypothetical protein
MAGKTHAPFHDREGVSARSRNYPLTIKDAGLPQLTKRRLSGCVIHPLSRHSMCRRYALATDRQTLAHPVT